MQLVFMVPGKPVGKGRPRFAKTAKFVGAYTPQETINYENWIKQCFVIKYPNFKPLETPLQLTVKAFLNKAKTNKMAAPMIKPDIDNIIKCMDALNGIAYKDDKQIVAVVAHKLWGDIERLEIALQEI